MQRVVVSTENSYTVSIGAGLLDQCGTMIRETLGPHAERVSPGWSEPRRMAIITDSVVGPLYASVVRESLTCAGFTTSIFTFAAGETSKTSQTFVAALEFLASEQLERSDCVVALGGGVVGDLAGFVAGCYLRGIRYVQLPTTLLAAVDSSVGGKTAIDLCAGKNLAGLFWQPSAVICDTNCLQTLPSEVFLDGLAEAVKTGILDDETLFALFEQDILYDCHHAEYPDNHSDTSHDDYCCLPATALSDHIEAIITGCITFKASVVRADEHEHGLRTILNLGHTIGHAIEVCSNYTLSHGHAVAIGIAMISRAAAYYEMCDKRDALRIVKLLSAIGLPVTTEFSTDELMQVILHDKKRAGSRITLVLPKKIGSCFLHEIALDALPTLLEAGKGDLL